MSFDSNWDPDRYREDHESDEHWELRRAFMERWKNDYPEERLVCLARVFTNIEFMGCRYPPEIMHEVAGLSHEVAKAYRNSRKTKLQRTFVSASTAAEDRAKGVKREGGVVTETPPSKSAKIDFVAQGEKVESDNDDEEISNDDKKNETVAVKSPSEVKDAVSEYLDEMGNIKCLNVREFHERMFHTGFGRMVLLVRPWAGKLSNIIDFFAKLLYILGNVPASCQACGVNIQTDFQNGFFSMVINGQLVARATGASKAEAKSIVEIMAWNRLKQEVVSLMMKEQWIAHNGSRITAGDVSGRRQDSFGTPLDSSVAAKMMKMMGWKGGGLGADAQGIAEPIQPNMQMVNRAGLGSSTTDLKQLLRAANDLMRRYVASDSIDVDLVFTSEFSKEERATLHHCAMRYKLASKSYGDKDRFLVVKKKLDPFSLVRAVIEKGGITPKYQVYIPVALRGNGR